MSHSIGMRTISVAVMLLCLAALAPSAGAGTPADSSAWSAEYYNNIDLSGPPAVLRGDAEINFFWPEGASPAPGRVNVDHYSARWTRELYFDKAGTWVFKTVNDDGMRVWVDDRITMDAWYDQGPTTHRGKIELSAGWHVVKVEYYNRALGGTARVSWSFETASGEWTGEYFNNQSLAGSPVLVRQDSQINFNWGRGSPDARIPANHFSVRWTCTDYLSAGTWRFTAIADDGLRLWVDGNLLIDEWNDQPATAYSRDIYLPAGNHRLKMEYYENTVDAFAWLSYDLLTDQAAASHGQYFDNISLSGAPAFVRDDAQLDFDWGLASPGPGVSPDHFSAKWDTTRTFAAGQYDIIATADDGVRVWIDGALALDYWYEHPTLTFSSTRYLSEGAHAVHVEYYEHLVFARIQVEIKPHLAPPSGEVVVDDGGAGFEMGGCPSCWRSSASGIGGHSYWTWNNASTEPGYNWVRWSPALSRGGNYEVLAYVPVGIATTTSARYWVHHGGQYSPAPRSQANYSNQWVSLGVYYFAGLKDEQVSLTDVTYECFLCRTIAFDAMKFSPR